MSSSSSHHDSGAHIPTRFHKTAPGQAHPSPPRGAPASSPRTHGHLPHRFGGPPAPAGPPVAPMPGAPPVNMQGMAGETQETPGAEPDMDADDSDMQGGAY